MKVLNSRLVNDGPLRGRGREGEKERGRGEGRGEGEGREREGVCCEYAFVVNKYMYISTNNKVSDF